MQPRSRPVLADPVGAEHERYQRQLRDANEHLVIAALSAQKQHAAAQLTQRRQTEFLAILAHELRNPLAPLRSGLEAMQLAAGDPQVMQEAMSLMDRQVSQLVHLVDDLLDSARIATGTFNLRRERVEVGRIIGNAVETSMPQIRTAGHDLQIDLAQESLLVDADPLRLAQVFTNLLNNAAKYTPAGGSIRLSALRSADEVVVTVKDSGIGIAQELLLVIFEMFTRVGDDRPLGQGGLGIGLALVHRLAELHGGSVTAQSAGLGQGSTFVVRLPHAT